MAASSFIGHSNPGVISQNTFKPNCDAEALEVYNQVLEETGNQQAATDAYQYNYWDCMDHGGMSSHEVTVELTQP